MSELYIVVVKLQEVTRCKVKLYITRPEIGCIMAAGIDRAMVYLGMPEYKYIKEEDWETLIGHPSSKRWHTGGVSVPVRWLRKAGLSKLSEQLWELMSEECFGGITFDEWEVEFLIENKREVP